MIHELPKKLEEIRLKCGYTQDYVAKSIGEPSAIIIWAYENGEKSPTADVLFALSKLYHCNIEYFFGNPYEYRPDLLDITDLPDAQKKALFTLVDSMKA